MGSTSSRRSASLSVASAPVASTPSASASTAASTAAALANLPASVAASLVDVSTLAHTRQLPVGDSLKPLMTAAGSSGLPRGSRICVDSGTSSRASVSLTFGLLVEAMEQGSWAAVVGCPWLGLGAVKDSQIPLSQLVMINDVASHWGSVMAAVVDGFDLVVFAGRPVGARDARRVQAHAREKGTVLVQIGDRGWSESADVQLTVTQDRWDGVGQGHGHLRRRRAEVLVSGRRRPSSSTAVSVWLPDADGAVRVLTPAELATPGLRDEGQWSGSDIDHLIEVDASAAGAAVEADHGHDAPPRLRSV